MARPWAWFAVLALLIATPAAQGFDPSATVSPPFTRGTNVYPPSGMGPPGSAAYDLERYRRKHSRRSTTEQTCADGASGCTTHDMDIAFSGDTGLDVRRIPDAFAIITGIGAQQLKCSSLSAVRSEVLKPGDIPPNDLDKDIGAPADYERWTATLCGKQVAFLMGVWAADDKRPPFRIVYPFAP
jgi:hypothetical protein